MKTTPRLCLHKNKIKTKKLKIIENWMMFFPCNRYYNGKDCINEYISIEDMFNFVEGQTNEKR